MNPLDQDDPSTLPAPPFEEHRTFCFAIAYRMLGSVSDAEDLVQECWLRWQAHRDCIDSPRAWLRRVCTRLAIDRLRERQRPDALYPGPWLPEPLLDQSPQLQAALDDRLDALDSLSMAFLTLLEKLGPLERAVYLLRAIFECSYAEISTVIQRKSDHCRQLYARAKRKIPAERVACNIDPEQQSQCLSRFYRAIAQGDLQALMDALDPQVELLSDGGGKRSAARKPLLGAPVVAKFLLGVAKLQSQAGGRMQPTLVNGRCGALVLHAEAVDSVISYEIVGGRLQKIFIVRNPDKLMHLSAQERRTAVESER